MQKEMFLSFHHQTKSYGASLVDGTKILMELSPHEKIISVTHAFLTESFGELKDEVEKCNAQYVFITSNYLGELKVMLKIGEQLGKINPDEYIINGNLTPRAKRTTLYTLWNKPPGYE